VITRLNTRQDNTKRLLNIGVGGIEESLPCLLFILVSRGLVKASISHIKAFEDLRIFLEDYGSFQKAMKIPRKLQKLFEDCGSI